MKDYTFIKIYIIFIICVIMITIYYKTYFNNNSILHESFVNNKSLDQIPSTTPYNISTLILDIDLTDDALKNIIINYLTELKTNLDKYKSVEIPITINNNGELCTPWGNYNNSIYNNNDNSCIIINKSNNIRKCLNNSRMLSSCSKLYSDGVIDNTSKIDISNLLNKTSKKIVKKINDLNIILNTKNSETDTVINNIINKLTQEQQQLYFIKNNENNINDKQHNFNNINNDLLNNHTSANISQMNFSNFKDNDSKNETTISFYYNCMIGLIITIVIIIIINVLISNVSD